MVFKIHTEVNDLEEYNDFILQAINCGFLLPHDVLISDNAKYPYLLSDSPLK